jgi:peptidoglycan/xylan/chitin deacetylase (PgdA/CDA1 family)
MAARALVLRYHAVSSSWPHRLAVTPESFERQLRALLHDGMRPRVTFDGAFRSVRCVVPLLEQLAIPVTVFACTGCASTGAPLVLPELAHEADARPEDLATMSWDELRELAGRGIAVGSHTAHHPHLRTLDDDELREELVGSRERIEHELDRPCRTLAYPYGEHDRRVRAAARDAGYATAYALVPADGHVDDFCLPRVPMGGPPGSAPAAQVRLAPHEAGDDRRDAVRRRRVAAPGAEQEAGGRPHGDEHGRDADEDAVATLHAPPEALALRRHRPRT